MTKTSRASTLKSSVSEKATNKIRKRTHRKDVSPASRHLVSKYLADEIEQEMLHAEDLYETESDIFRTMFGNASYLLGADLTEDWDTDFGTYRIDYGTRH